MPRYTVRSLSKSGEVVEHGYAASNPDEAMNAARKRGFVPIAAERIDRAGQKGKRALPFLTERRVGAREVLTFTRELAMLLKAGIPLDRSLDRLVELQPSSHMKKLLRSVSQSVKSGRTLSAAMSVDAAVFPSFYTGLVSAGETGGTLKTVLDDIADILEARLELSQKITSSLMYPLIVLVMIALSVTILMVWVVPEFRPLLESRGPDIPISAALVLFVSGLLIDWGWLFALAACLAAVVMLRMLKDEPNRRVLDGLLLQLPKIGDIVTGFETARYCRTLGTLLANGVTITDSAGLAAASVGNKAVRRSLSSASDGLSRGKSLATVLRGARVFDPLVLEIIAVGEEAGSLDGMLVLAAETAQSRAQSSLEKLTVLVAPVVTIVLGAFVALVIGTILSAIMGSYDVPF